MDIRTIITSFRKLGNFLVTVFPALGRVSRWFGLRLAACASNPVIASILNRLTASPQIQALVGIAQRFWWKNYAKDRVDWTQLPAESAPILRPVFQVSLALCFLLPAAMAWPWPPLPGAARIGAEGPVAAWPVLLWMLAMALGWSCLLVGTALSNRVAGVLTALLFLYYFSYTAFFSLPRSFWNLPVPLTALLAGAYLECVHAPRGRRGIIASYVSCLAVALYAGVLAVGLTPLARLGTGPAGYFIRLLAGLVLGLLLAVWSNSRRSERYDRFFSNAPATAPIAVGTLATLIFFELGVLAFRGGLVVPADATLRFLLLWTGYLWPLWYLMGAGIIYKLLKHSTIVTQALRELVPGVLFVPLSILFFLAGTLCCWSEWILDTVALPWPRFWVRFIQWVYALTFPVVWKAPLYAYAANFMRWVFLAALIAAIGLAVRRRLDTGNTATLLFQTLLLWFASVEYYLQFVSLGRPGVTSAVIMLVLALSMLWSFYTMGMELSLSSSRRWPALGRLTIYGGMLLFILLEIHCRGAIHDASAVGKIFYYLFRGMVEFGLPYFLYVYAGRRLPRSPLPLHHVIAAFAGGAGLALVLNALDKFAVAAGSWAAVQADLDFRLNLVLAGNSALLETLVPNLSAGWILTRCVLIIGFWVLLAATAGRRSGPPEELPVRRIFLLAASAAGIAAFSQTRLDVPVLSWWWSLLFSPYRYSLELDANIVGLYLTCMLPALLFGVMITRPGRPGWFRWGAGAGCSLGLLFIAAWLWPGREAWLESSGLILTVGMAAFLLFLALIRTIKGRVAAALVPPDNETVSGASGEAIADAAGGPIDNPSGKSGTGVAEEPAAGPASATVISAPEPPVPARWHGLEFRLAGTLGLGLLALGAIAACQAAIGWPAPHALPGLKAPLTLPSAWTPLPHHPPGLLAVFSRPSLIARKPVLAVSVEKLLPGGADAYLRQWLTDAPGAFPDFDPLRDPVNWDRHQRGARAVDFFFSRPLPGGGSEPVAATLAVVPRPRDELLIMLLMCGIPDRDARRWDLIYATESLGGK